MVWQNRHLPRRKNEYLNSKHIAIYLLPFLPCLSSKGLRVAYIDLNPPEYFHRWKDMFSQRAVLSLSPRSSLKCPHSMSPAWGQAFLCQPAGQQWGAACKSRGFPAVGGKLGTRVTLGWLHICSLTYLSCCEIKGTKEECLKLI